MEATAPELGPVRFWSPKSSSFSGSNSIVVEEAAKKRSKSTAECKTTGAPNFFIEHDKVQSKSQQSKIVHFIHKTGCTFAAAFHLNIFYHKLPHISITYI